MGKATYVRITAIAILAIIVVLTGDTSISVNEKLLISDIIFAVKDKLIIIGVIGISFGVWADSYDSYHDEVPDMLIKFLYAFVQALCLISGVAGGLAYLDLF